MTVAIRNVAELSPAERREKPEALADALFRPMGVAGVYARTQLYEEMVERLVAWISRKREPGTEVLRFPPVMSRRDLEKAGYLKSFPNLLGCVCALHGSEGGHPRRRRPARCRRRLDRFAVPRRPGSQPRRLLPRLYDCGEPRPGSARRLALRCRRRLLPPRALERPRPAAVVPHARICLHRPGRRGHRVPRPLDAIGPALWPASSACPTASSRRATPSSAAPARSWR